MFRRGRNPFRSALFLVSLLGLFAATDTAWSLDSPFDLTSAVREAPRLALEKLRGLAALFAADGAGGTSSGTGGGSTSGGGSGSGVTGVGVIIDPNGPPRG